MRDTYEIHVHVSAEVRGYMEDTYGIHEGYIMRYMYLNCIQRGTYLQMYLMYLDVYERDTSRYDQDTCRIHRNTSGYVSDRNPPKKEYMYRKPHVTPQAGLRSQEQSDPLTPLNVPLPSRGKDRREFWHNLLTNSP
jgi:hypothetical protein